MSYSHLSIIERGQLETLHRLGWSTRAIACQLGRHHATIARELNRSQSGPCYGALRAQQAYQERRAASVPAGKFTPELASALQDKLKQTWSPEQIAEKRRCEGVNIS
nr:helix-turn-helix domain-containing protein [Paenibacillus humicola]